MGDSSNTLGELLKVEISLLPVDSSATCPCGKQRSLDTINEYNALHETLEVRNFQSSCLEGSHCLARRFVVVMRIIRIHLMWHSPLNSNSPFSPARRQQWPISFNPNQFSSRGFNPINILRFRMSSLHFIP